MDDRYDRRELLLHLGDVLEAVHCLAATGEWDMAPKGLLATTDSLQDFSILKHVDAGMTAGQFVTKATGALFLWPKELLDTELNRKALAHTLRHDLFAGNPGGWSAFSKEMRAKVSWFGDGVPDRAKPDTEGDDNSAAPVGAVSQQADDAGTGKPLWPWSEDNPPPA